MLSINIKRIAVGVTFVISVLMAGAATNDAHAKKWKGDNHRYQCDERHPCYGWRGGVYNRQEDGVNYYYGGLGHGYGYGFRQPRYSKFYYVDEYDYYDAPIYYQQ